MVYAERRKPSVGTAATMLGSREWGRPFGYSRNTIYRNLHVTSRLDTELNF